VIVSHDRDFLDGLVNKIYEFKDGRVREHLGGVTDFLTKKKMDHLKELEINTIEKKSQEVLKENKKELISYSEQKEIERSERKKRTQIENCEKSIDKLESQIGQIETVLANPSKNEAFDDLLKKYNELKIELEKKLNEWERLQS
jgi:ATP-binding cassette subfamily F protein 3